jgi:hypothetical protein
VAAGTEIRTAGEYNWMDTGSVKGYGLDSRVWYRFSMMGYPTSPAFSPAGCPGAAGKWSEAGAVKFFGPAGAVRTLAARADARGYSVFSRRAGRPRAAATLWVR